MPALAALKKLTEPDLIMEICDHVANGGSLIQLCDLWGLHYHQALRFVNGDPARKKAYKQALDDRKEWAIERLLGELKMISCVDMTQVIDGNGCLCPVENWPADAKQNLKKIVVKELFESDGAGGVKKVGELKTVEFHDKLKAIDMYGKQLKMWTDAADGGKGASLADLLVAAKALKD